MQGREGLDELSCGQIVGAGVGGKGKKGLGQDGQFMGFELGLQCDATFLSSLSPPHLARPAP